MELFEHGLSPRFSVWISKIMRKEPSYARTSPITVALACRAAGIDRSVFMTVFQLSRHHRRVTGAQLSDSDHEVSISAVFKPKSQKPRLWIPT